MVKLKTIGLTWRQAWFELLNGRKIKLPSWKGYWKWENHTIMMHCSDGEIIDIRETTNPAYTFTNIAENDWMVVSDDYEIIDVDQTLENKYVKNYDIDQNNKKDFSMPEYLITNKYSKLTTNDNITISNSKG